MTESISAQYRRHIETLLEKLEVNEEPARERVYARARTAVRAMLERNNAQLSPEKRGELLQSLETTIEQIEAEQKAGEIAARDVDMKDQTAEADLLEVPILPAAAPVTAALPVAKAPRRGGLAFAAGFVVALAVVVGALFAAQAAGMIGIATSPAASARQARMEQLVSTTSADLSARWALLDKVRAGLEDIKTRTGSYPQTKAGTPLEDVVTYLPDLKDDIESVLARGESKLRMRIAGEGYKLLYTSVLCTVVQITAPQRVDPVRQGDADTCVFFGTWNEAGREL